MGQGQSVGPSNSQHPSPMTRSDGVSAGENAESDFEEITYVDAADTESHSDSATRRSSGSLLRLPFCICTGSQSTELNASDQTDVDDIMTVAHDDSTADDDLIYCACRQISLQSHTVRNLGLARKKFYCERYNIIIILAIIIILLYSSARLRSSVSLKLILINFYYCYAPPTLNRAK